MDSEKKTDVQGLIEKGKSQGSLSSDDIMEMVDLSGYDVDQVEKLYETLESSGIEVNYNLDGDYADERDTEEVEVPEEGEDIEKYLADEGVSVDDPVRMYLKDIGRIPLLSTERETYLAERIADGDEAAKRIRALDDPQKAGIPIVAVTANAFEEDRHLALDSGMNGHLAKPYDIPAIMETLKELLR